MTGRLLWAYLPPRQQRRISNFVYPAKAVSFPASLLPGRAPGGRVERVGSATAIFLHLFRRPAKNADQHVSKPFGSVSPSVFGFFHEHIMGVSNAEVVAPDYVTERG